MAFRYIADEYGSSYACDGICFDPARVKSEIFTLEGVYQNSFDLSFEGSWEDQMLVLKEVSRTISIISLHSRFQITSYFQRIPQEVKHEARKQYLQTERAIANAAMGKSVGYAQKALDKPARVLNFYDAIGKICHVEKWRYPMNIPEEQWQLYPGIEKDNPKNLLLIEITKRGHEPVTGNVEYCWVDLPKYSAAAFDFVSDCPDCMEVIHDEMLAQPDV